MVTNNFHSMRFFITESPYQPGNPVLGSVNVINGIPCPEKGITANTAQTIYEFLNDLKYVWLSNKTMPEFDNLNPEHIRAAMASLDCVGYHAEELKE